MYKKEDNNEEDAQNRGCHTRDRDRGMDVDAEVDQRERWDFYFIFIFIVFDYNDFFFLAFFIRYF